MYVRSGPEVYSLWMVYGEGGGNYRQSFTEDGTKVCVWTQLIPVSEMPWGTIYDGHRWSKGDHLLIIYNVCIYV